MHHLYDRLLVVQLDDFSDGGKEGFLLHSQNRGYTVGAQQCCGSGTFIPYPDFYPSRIPDPKIATKERGEKKNCCPTFICSHKKHKIENYINFELVKEKFWANLQRIIDCLPKKLSLSSQKYRFGVRDPRSGIRDPGSGKNLFRIPDPGVKKAPDPGSATLVRSFKYVLLILRVLLWRQ